MDTQAHDLSDMRFMNTINLISETQGTSKATLALSMVRAICHQKDVFTVQIARPGEQTRTLHFKLDYQARFKANLDRLLLEISGLTAANEGYSIRAAEPEQASSSEKQIIRLMNAASLDEFLSAKPGIALQA